MTLKIAIDSVDGETSHFCNTETITEALKFLEKYDHEGSSINLMIIGIFGENVYKILRKLEKENDGNL